MNFEDTKEIGLVKARALTSMAVNSMEWFTVLKVDLAMTLGPRSGKVIPHLIFQILVNLGECHKKDPQYCSSSNSVAIVVF